MSERRSWSERRNERMRSDRMRSVSGSGSERRSVSVTERMRGLRRAYRM